MKRLNFLDSWSQRSIKLISLSEKVQVFSLFSALLLSSVILIAGLGKIFSPNDDRSILDMGVGFFEIGLIISLILCRNQIQIWLIASVVFALWGSYSLFWYLTELPCSCMGESIYVPHGFSLVIDILFFSLSFCTAYWLGAPKKNLTLLFVNALIFMAGGYALAKWVFEYILLN